jgi:hypothetical protein
MSRPETSNSGTERAETVRTSSFARADGWSGFTAASTEAPTDFEAYERLSPHLAARISAEHEPLHSTERAKTILSVGTVIATALLFAATLYSNIGPK